MTQPPATHVAVGPYVVLAGGLYMDPEKLSDATLLASLLHDTPPTWPEDKPRLVFPIADFSAPEKSTWKAWLEGKIIPELAKGARLAVHCTAGIGRTGTFLASLVAILESQTADPIEAVRERYRPDAVETIRQGEVVFALRGAPLPNSYYHTLRR